MRAIERKKRFKKVIKNVSSVVVSLLAEGIEHYVDERFSQKKVWVRNWIDRRSTHGASAMLLKELRLEDPGEYKALLRMSPELFNVLHGLIATEIQQSDTVMREAIPSKIKLEATLSFLATGSSYRCLQNLGSQVKPSCPENRTPGN